MLVLCLSSNILFLSAAQLILFIMSIYLYGKKL